MTLSEALSLCERDGGTGLTGDEKTAILSGLDGRIHDEILSHYEGTADFAGYTAETDGGTELLVSSPYDEIYPVYLMSIGAVISGSDTRYSVYSTLFNNLYSGFARRCGNTLNAKTVKVKGY